MDYKEVLELKWFDGCLYFKIILICLRRRVLKKDGKLFFWDILRYFEIFKN